MSRTAVVILNYNGEALLRQFLPSVIQHSNEATIIVADNGSTDASLTVLKESFPEVDVISLDKNYGFCGGYNRALKQVESDYYVLLNSDVEVTANWLKPMITLLDENATIGAVQPKILSFSEKDIFEYAGAAGGFIDSLAYPFCRGRIFDTREADNGQYNDSIPIFWATGACLMIRANLYDKFGGLDEDFFAHMEEIDLCWKLQRSGSEVYYCGQSSVHHLGAGTLGYASPRKTYLNFRNGLILLTKHLELFELLWKLPVRLGLDWMAALQYLFKGKFDHSSAIIRAHAHFLSRLSSTLQKRSQLHRLFPSYSRKTVFKGSILWNYFVRGRRTYDKLINNPR